MQLLGIIGYPLSHSFSKKYFTEKFDKEKIKNYSFQNFELTAITQLPNILIKHPNLIGFAITIPYKQTIIPYLHCVAKNVQAMQACNCVKIVQGKLYGFNTDVVGFQKSLQPLLQKHHTKALILGTGGASQAVAYVLKQLNIQFLFVTRNKLLQENQIPYNSLNESIIQEHLLIINASPVGTFPNVTEAPEIPYQFLTSNHYCFDLVYNPPLTMFLSLAQQQKAIIKNGFDMLAIQAEENWKIWNDTTATNESLL